MERRQESSPNSRTVPWLTQASEPRRPGSLAVVHVGLCGRAVRVVAAPCRKNANHTPAPAASAARRTAAARTRRLRRRCRAAPISNRRSADLPRYGPRRLRRMRDQRFIGSCRGGRSSVRSRFSPAPGAEARKGRSPLAVPKRRRQRLAGENDRLDWALKQFQRKDLTSALEQGRKRSAALGATTAAVRMNVPSMSAR